MLIYMCMYFVYHVHGLYLFDDLLSVYSNFQGPGPLFMQNKKNFRIFYSIIIKKKCRFLKAEMTYKKLKKTLNFSKDVCLS